MASGSRRRRGGWLAVAAVSIASNLTWFAVGRKFKNGPVGQLNRRILKGSGS